MFLSCWLQKFHTCILRWWCAWLWNFVISILVVVICDIVMKFCLLAWELNGLVFNWLKNWRNFMLPLLEILALVEKYRECMWLIKWKTIMLKWIKLTLDEVLKTRIKEELIPHWMLKSKFDKAKWKKRKIVFD